VLHAQQVKKHPQEQLHVLRVKQVKYLKQEVQHV
jgi:hypothetical protein